MLQAEEHTKEQKLLSTKIMDQLSSSLKKSFKHTKKVSHDIENQPILSHQSPDAPSASSSVNSSSLTARSSIDLNDRREVIVKIDGEEKIIGNERNTLWHEPSYEFWREDSKSGPRTTSFQRGKDMPEDPPSKLIGQFLNKQRAVGCEMTLDMDLEMDELRNHIPKPENDSTAGSSPVNLPRIIDSKNNNNHHHHHHYTTSKDLRVSFQAPSPPPNVVDIEPDQTYNDNNDESCSSDEEEDGDTPDEPQYLSRRRTMNINNPDDSNNSNNAYYTPKNNAGDSQVLRCTSFQRRASVLGRAKTKSRLIDPPEIPERKSGKIGKSGQMRSGMLGRASGMLKPIEDDDDDPLFDEDLPEEFKKNKIDCLTLLQWISLILIVTALICTLTIPLLKKKGYKGLHLWKWEVLVLVLICGRLLSGWVIRLVVFFIERNFLLRKRVLYFVYGVRKAVQNCLWLGLVLIAWHFMFDKKVDENNTFLGYINKLMICMLIGTMLWLVKTLMVKVLASSFHVSTFFDRIQESLFNQYVIETLSGPPLMEIQRSQEEEDRTMAEVWKIQNMAGAQLPPELRPPVAPQYSSKKGASVNGGQTPPPKPSRTVSISVSGISGPLSKNPDEVQNQGISIDHLHKLNPKNISAWNMKRLIKIVRYGVISTLDEQILDTKREDDTTTQIRSEYEAKVAARKIFRNVAKPRSKYIYPDDLRCFLREEEAFKTLNLVEGSPDRERISRAALKNWVVNAFRERRALALTLNDTKTAVNKLHQMVNVLVGVIILLICLVILGIATSKFLLFVSSQVVVVAFVFGNTCKTIFESIIFLFVMHPFDVGDRCEVDGVQLIVEEMNILTTVFLRFDNQKIMYPNSTLSTRAIGNYYRSPDMGDSVDFNIHIATPAEKIAVMKQRICSYIESKKDYWYPSPSVVLMNLEDLSKLKMSVWIRHRMNHQDMGERWTRRAQLIDEMVKTFKELDIEYRLYPIDINVRGMPPITSNRIPSTWPTAGN